MPSLLEVQRGFAAALDAPAHDGARAYRANVLGNRAAALAGAYPIVRKIVGTAFFDALAHAYGRAHPSASGDLNAYGARLAEFVAAFSPTQDLPYLPDVARMEWLAHRAYYAAEPRPLDPASIDRVRLAPACALLESPWPLERIWQTHQHDYQGEVDVDLNAGAQRILVHRPRWRVEVCALSAPEHAFLAALEAGSALVEALEAAVRLDPCFDPARAAAKWTVSGVLSL